MDEDQLWRDLEQTLLEMIEVSRRINPLVLLGKVGRSQSGEKILVIGEDPETVAAVNLEEIVPHGRLVVTTDGEFRNLPRGFFDGLIVPEARGERLTEAMRYAYLRGACVSEANYAAPLLRKFVESVPQHVSLDV